MSNQNRLLSDEDLDIIILKAGAYDWNDENGKYYVAHIDVTKRIKKARKKLEAYYIEKYKKESE